MSHCSQILQHTWQARLCIFTHFHVGMRYQGIKSISNIYSPSAILRLFWRSQCLSGLVPCPYPAQQRWYKCS
jgi:hypothetical protein